MLGMDDFPNDLLKRGSPRANRWLALGFALASSVPLLLGLALETLLPKSPPSVGGAWIGLGGLASIAALVVFLAVAYYRRGLGVSWTGWAWAVGILIVTGLMAADTLGRPAPRVLIGAIFALLLFVRVPAWWYAYCRERRAGWPSVSLGWLLLLSLVWSAWCLSFAVGLWWANWAFLALALVVGIVVRLVLWRRPASPPSPPPPHVWRPGAPL